MMSNVDSWFGKKKMDDESDGNLKSSSNGGNMDAELASIVSSLSALSNTTNNNGSNGASDRRGSAQLGGFRRSSLGYTTTGTATTSPAGTSAHHVGGTSNSGEQELLMYSSMGPGGVTEEAASSQSSSPIVTRRAALSVGTAPPYNSSYGSRRLHQDESLSGQHFFGDNNRLHFMGHYSASIAGPILFNHNDGKSRSGDGGFFEKFGKSLIEGTRELEDESNSATDISTVTQINGNGESIADSQNHMVASLQDPRRTSVTSTSTASEPMEQLADANTSVKRNIWNVAAAPIFKPDTNNMDQYSILPQQQNQQETSSNPPPFAGTFIPPFLPPAITPAPIPAAEGAPPLDAAPFLHNPYLYLANDLYPGIPPTPQPGVTSAEGQHSNNNCGFPGSNMVSTRKSRTATNVPPGKRNTQGKNSSRKHQGINPYLDNPNNTSTHVHGGRNTSASPHSSRDRNNNNNHNNNNNNHNNNNSHNSSSNHNNNNGGNNGGSKRKHNGSSRANSSVGMNSRPKSSANNNKWANYYATRSPVLEEFRANPTNRTYELKDIAGYVLEFCQDQHGSRFIQCELAVATPSERDAIFSEIKNRIVELSDDVFGNYVIQKFFEFGSKTQKNILINKFKGKMQELSMQMYACRVVQRALEFIELDKRIELVNELSSCVLEMIKDQNGNHVIQKAIESIPMTELPFILDSLDGQIYHLSTHAYGCRVIQRLLEFGSENDQSRIFNEIKDFIPYLIQDQYGNYVIQHVLQQDGSSCLKDMAETKQDIVNIVSQTVVEFSKHKFASNVVEKAILYGTNEQRDLIMSKVIPSDETSAVRLEENSPMVLMMRDQFANYVVQKLVGVSEGKNKRLIVMAIRSYLERLNASDSVGSRNLASVEKLASLVETVTR